MTTTLATISPSVAVPQTISLRFVTGMPGLEQYTRYTLIAVDNGPIFWLECADERAIALPVADAFAVAPDYSFDLYHSDARALGLNDPSSALVLVILSVPCGAGTITANLFAPIVINRRTGAAKQVILDGTRHSLRQPIEMVE